MMGLIRRVWLGIQSDDGRPVADAEGVAGEDFETEVYHPHGLSSNVAGEGILLSFNNNADNHTALPARGSRMAASGTVLLYFDDETEIEISPQKIAFTIGGNFMTLENGIIKTDMNIETTGTIRADGDVLAGSISLKTHKHLGVTAGMGTTGLPL